MTCDAKITKFFLVENLKKKEKKERDKRKKKESFYKLVKP